MFIKSLKLSLIFLSALTCFAFGASAYSFTAEDVKIAYDTAVYTGKEVCPTVSVKNLSSSAYFVTYANNVNAGRAVVIVDEVNDSCEPVYKYFDILPCNIARTEIKLSYSQTTYNGKARKPSVTVSYNGKVLLEGKDYKVSYRNNKKVGKAVVKVKGAGNFCGEAEAVFYITPKKPKSLKTEKRTSKSVTLSWKKVSGATEYRIYRYKDKKWKLVGTTDKTEFRAKKLKSDKEYKFRVKAVCKTKSKKLYSDFSKTLTVRTRLSGNDKVYVTPKGSKYHRKNCSYIKNGKKVTYSYAKDHKYSECSRCF